MAFFSDSSGRKWTVALTVLDVKKLRENASVVITDPESLSELFDDATLQYEVLWTLVEPQAAKFGVDATVFAEVFTECFATASKALVESIQLFFRQTGRTDLSGVIERILSASIKLQSIVERNLSSTKFGQVLDKIVTDEDTRINEAMDRHLLMRPTTGSLESQESSGSSPGASPSGS